MGAASERASWKRGQWGSSLECAKQRRGNGTQGKGYSVYKALRWGKWVTRAVKRGNRK